MPGDRPLEIRALAQSRRSDGQDRKQSLSAEDATPAVLSEARGENRGKDKGDAERGDLNARAEP